MVPVYDLIIFYSFIKVLETILKSFDMLNKGKRFFTEIAFYEVFIQWLDAVLAVDLVTQKLWDEAGFSHLGQPVAILSSSYENTRHGPLWRCFSRQKICSPQPIVAIPFLFENMPGSAYVWWCLTRSKTKTRSAYCGDAFHDWSWCPALPIVAMPSPFEDDAWIGLIVAMRCLSRPKTMPDSVYCGECLSGFGDSLSVEYCYGLIIMQ